MINENQREKGWDEVNVEPFRGSASVHDPEGEIVEKRLNKDFFANLKAQSWWYLRLRFQNTYRALNGQEYDSDMLISLSSQDIDPNEMTQLVMELSQPTYMKNGVGKILVNKQPDGAISPNRADAVMICYCPLVSALDIWSKL